MSGPTPPTPPEYSSTTAAPTLPELFAARAGRNPDATAVLDGERTLTYGELDRRAARLARRLVAAGAGPERIVAIAVGRSVDLVVAMLAVVRSGAAYLPLDRAYPTARTAFMLADAAPVAVVVDDAGAPSGAGGVPTVAVADREPPAGVRLGAVDPASPAYVIYTSGSTGAPKGVPVPHASVVALFAATREIYGVAAADVWSCCHSASFDFSVWEIWGALVSGGATVILSNELTWSPRDLLAAFARHGVTVLSQTPSSFDRLLAAEQEREVAGEPPLAVTTIVFGGEALDPARLHGRLATLPRLVNMYGITETTVHVTHVETGPGAPRSVGSPLPGLTVVLRDERLAPVGPDAIGEIYVSGPQLARGYLGRPTLTATRFVADPDGVGARAYRAGDLAVRDGGSGELVFAGRADAQLKVRGFRIEPGEIEAVLIVHPRVAGCAVTAQPLDGGARGLVAHVVAAGAPLDEGELTAIRAHAADRLPAHLVPALVVPIAELPLTPNGKLDRAALSPPAPAAGRPDRRELLRRRIAAASSRR
ncbi:amino acid adenylation domain-containing protein [Pseudonocardia sp. GCM10023141]|uniref:amino acid adenylation domain-containing protein n=1 Tax=Pseudonocardia sp. GCM10023141 TaxID=3252653 RepID=UPI00360FE7BD